jgi:mitosis inhibitor protein kinase SWE1
MEALSPHREDSGPGSPAHLHSPHRLGMYDHQTALGEIQRSLSRSPSKTSDYRARPQRSISPFSTTPANPSPLSPSRKAASDLFLNASASNSPFVGRSTPIRINRTGLRRTAQTTGGLRTRTSPKSPSKRVLGESSTSGNATPIPLRKRSSDDANREQGLHFQDISMDKDKENRFHDDNMSSRPVYTRQEKRRSGGSLMSFIPPSSPMKRPEAPRSTDQDDFHSPSAKRRSLHGPGLDFSIFESDSLTSSFNDDRSQDDNDWLRTGSAASNPRFSTVPKRSSSLRKSTLQQRQGENLQTKLNQPLNLDSSWLEATPAARNQKGLRMSLDNHIDPLPRDSPFAAQGPLLSASVHPASSAQNSQESQVQHARHPLSRTMTQSSSTSSAQDESPTHEPVHRPRPRSHEFPAKVPLSSSRPSPQDTASEFSSQTSFATPGNYKFAKPLPAAFMSTGLISKKNRNVEDPNAGLPKAHMPDTPCKRQSIMFPAPTNFNGRKSLANNVARQSFGTPSTPIADGSAGFNKPAPFHLGKSVGLFGTRPANPSLTRKASFASIITEDKASQSPSQRTSSQSTESSFPPTPTKPLEEAARQSTSPSPFHTRTQSVPQATVQGTPYPSSKLSPIQASPDSTDGDSDAVMQESPSANMKPKKSLVNNVKETRCSFTRSRVSRHLGSPAPLSKKAVQPLNPQSPSVERAKRITSPVTPQADRYSPHTPLEGYFPPDPSALTISAHADRPATRNGPAQVVPATPTGPRDYFANFSNRPSLNLNSADLSNVDDSLMARFEKVELIGTGEFSQVYRVSQPAHSSPYHKIYAVSSPKPSKPASNVWAVKKSRHRYTGPKDRQNKLQEVYVLRALQVDRNDQLISFVDSWEEEGHLYIQTEFCEEGTLDVFLAQMGRKARVDDFRIWKILLELSMVSS